MRAANLSTQAIKSAKSAVITITSRWVSAKMAAQLFGVSTRTLSDWKDKALISYSKPCGENGTIFYDIESINKHIQKNKVI